MFLDFGMAYIGMSNKTQSAKSKVGAIEQYVAGKEAHAASFRDMLWSNTKDMDKHLYDGLRVLAKTGYSLAALSHGKTFFPQFLNDTFNDKIWESGCDK
jgi:hypothetical protein